MYPISAIHIELTDKCQAACPMCARNNSGGSERPFIQNVEITFDNFKKWFPTSFLSKIENFYSCGNYGDPVFAADCFEIYEHVRNASPNSRLAIHTNGSLRKTTWWRDLATVMGKNGEVIFAVDGFKGKHELYRRNTDLEKFLLNIGVRSVNFKSTKRFYNMTAFPVVNRADEYEYDLYPAQTDRFKQEVKIPLENFLDSKFLKKIVSESIISPQCVNKQEIYVDPHGNVLPCCYIGSDWLEQPLEEKLLLHTLRNITVNDSKAMMKAIGVPNLHVNNIEEMLSQSELWKDLESYWRGENKCMTCVKSCSGQLYNL